MEQKKLEGLQENEKKLEENLELLRDELLEKQKQLTKQEDITRKAEEMAKKVLVEQMEDEFTCIISALSGFFMVCPKLIFIFCFRHARSLVEGLSL